MSGLTGFGLACSAIWFAGVSYLVMTDWCNEKSLNEWGDFVAGFVGPLALLWLVLGYFQQQKEIRQNTEALHLQREEMRKAAEEQKNLVRSSDAQLNTLINSNSAHVLPNVKFHRINNSGEVIGPGVSDQEYTLCPMVLIQNYGNVPARDVYAEIIFQPLKTVDGIAKSVPDRTIRAEVSTDIMAPEVSIHPTINGSESEDDLKQRPKGSPDNLDYAILIRIEYRDMYNYAEFPKKEEWFRYTACMNVVQVKVSESHGANLSTHVKVTCNSIGADKWPGHKDLNDMQY